MNVQIIKQSAPNWLTVAEYAETCSWDACARMALYMRNNKFTDWERIFLAEKSDIFIGFCALLKAPNHFPEFEGKPFVKWLFVDENNRGHRISQILIESAAKYSNQLGYDKIYLTTWHQGLYEKYGFVKIGEKEMRENYCESIYEKTT